MTELLCGFLLGFIVALLFYQEFIKRSKSSGTFVIDLSDPKKDVCRLELDESLDSIYSKKQIVFNVKTYAELSQK